MQEGITAVFVSTEVILSLEQLWKLNPGLTILNCDDNTHVIYSERDILVSEITGVSKPPPHGLMRLDSSYSHPSLLPVLGQVVTR